MACPTMLIDPELRAKALKVIEVYKTKNVRHEEGPIGEKMAQGVRAVMQVVSEKITAYDKGELTPATQKKLISLMKKLVKQYPV